MITKLRYVIISWLKNNVPKMGIRLNPGMGMAFSRGPPTLIYA